MSFLATPLDRVLNSRSKVRVLRLLLGQDRSLSAREVARLTQTGIPSVLTAIEDLAKQGIIIREVSGRQFFCRANRDHVLVRNAILPLFNGEVQWPDALFDSIRTAFADVGRRGDAASPRLWPEIIAAWIFGSVAKGTDRPGSDLDLFVLLKNEDAKDDVIGRVIERSSEWLQFFGVDVKPMVMSVGKVRKELADGNRFLRDAIQHHRLIAGRIPPELRND
jgi:predicted nucleotidyltransferase/DNA-binding transcriptional ArsR family regulator